MEPLYRLRTDPDTTTFARDLRRNLTPAESRLWQALRGGQLHGLKFRRQAPIGPYIVDFACLAKRVVVEVDGDTQAERTFEDAARDAWLRERGYTVVRVTNREVVESVEGAVALILRACGMDGGLTE